MHVNQSLLGQAVFKVAAFRLMQVWRWVRHFFSENHSKNCKVNTT